MSRMKKRNLRNIKNIFEKKTGADLNPAHRMRSRRPVRTMLVFAAVIAACLVMAAFTYPLFTPLDGDELTLGATYEGDGLVSVFVENGSEKELEFQEQLKLISWNTGEEVETTGGEVVFYNTKFDAHTSGVMTVDLSKAYDVEALEQSVTNLEYFYLLLTNNSFLFGHDWICSFSFGEIQEAEETVEETRPDAPLMRAQTIGDIEEELQFYFEDAYYDEVAAFNEKNFEYQQKVQEILLRTGGTLVRPVDPMLIVDDAPADVVFDETYPLDAQYQLVGEHYFSLDGYRRIVGTQFSGTGLDFSLQLSGMIPQHAGQTAGGVDMIPLIYLFTYEAAAVQAEDAYAFIYGQILTFWELEQYKVYEDEQYVVYEVTDLFYTDLDAYIEYYLTTRDDLYFDENIRQRLHNIYDYFKNKENLGSLFYYNLPG